MRTYLLVGFVKPNYDYRTMLLDKETHEDDAKRGECESGDWSYYLVPGCKDIELIGEVEIYGTEVDAVDSIYYSD